MFDPVFSFLARRRALVSLGVAVVFAAAGLVLAPNASAAVASVPGVAVGIAPVACGSIVNMALSNGTASTQSFWLRQPLSDHSFAWVILPPHTSTTAQMNNPQGTGILNWGIILSGQTLASRDIAKYSGACYTGNYLPNPNSTAALAADVYAHCGAIAIVSMRNNTPASQPLDVYRSGTTAPVASASLGSMKALMLNLPVTSSAGNIFTVKNGATVLATQTEYQLAPCSSLGHVDWGTTLSAQDQFNATSVDANNWWIYDSPTSYPQRLPSQVSESGGELKLTGHVDPNYGTEMSGGIGYKKGQMYGHWEVRQKYDKGTGYRSAILLWPDAENWPVGGEIDISEVFDGPRAVEYEYQHNGADNKFIGQRFTADMSQWHTVGVDWLPNRVMYYLDGQEVWTVARPTDGSFSYVPSDGPMHVALQNDTRCTTICTDASTPANVTLHIDWMKQWPASAALLNANK